MDTKSRSCKPFWAWFTCMLGAGIVLTGLLVCLTNYTVRSSIAEAFFTDFFESDTFGSAAFSDFHGLASALSSSSAASYPGMTEQTEANYPYYLGGDILGEGDNALYYACTQSAAPLTNSGQTDFDSLLSDVLQRDADGEFGLVLIYANGTGVTRVHGAQSALRLYRDMFSSLSAGTLSALPQAQLLLAVPVDFNTTSSGAVASAWRRVIELRTILTVCLGVLIVGLFLWLFGLLMRKNRRAFVAGLMSLLSRVLLEIKLVFLLSVLALMFTAMDSMTYWSPVGAAIVVACLFCLWYFLLDMLTNRSKTFKNNILRLLLLHYRALERKKPFQKALILRIHALIAAETVLIFFSVLCFAWILSGSDGAGVFFLLMLLLITAGVYLLYRFEHRYRMLIGDIGLLIDQIARIRAGDMDGRLTLLPDRDLFKASDDLNNIQEGLGHAIADRVKSERMKVELITNVSHDLKTPLTSIISFADLLSKETLAPPEANDYVRVIRQKAERLNTMTRDLFDLSKAQSGNLELHLERLDLAEHVHQTLAELDEKIAASGLSFITSIPEEPLFVMADGGRLYRVFENLVVNALKYSLPGTRVYVRAARSGGRVVFEIKNISAAPLDFDSQEITERFTRGDSARTTEGSGLGLAIVRSFTESLNGRFSIILDGDLFKAILEFPEAGKPADVPASRPAAPEDGGGPQASETAPQPPQLPQLPPGAGGNR